MELAIILMIVYALGLVVGYEWASRRKQKDIAPAPVNYELGYDPNNHINARGHRGEKVMVCGVEMTRMN